MSLSEPAQPYNQTQFEQPVSGVVHTGSGDVKIELLVPGFDQAVDTIKRLISGEQIPKGEDAHAVEKLINTFQELRRYQKVVGELKRVHNMLHDLENALAIIESFTGKKAERKKTDLSAVEINWRRSASPQLRHLVYFATVEMEYLKPQCKINGDEAIGPPWVLDLIALQRNIEASLKEKNSMEIDQLSLEIHDKCRDHLYQIDRQLLQAVDRFERLFDQILMRIENARQ